LRKKVEKPSLFIRKDRELALSGIQLSVILQAVISRGKHFRFKALGCSMSPSIKDGDVLTVYPMTDKAPALGDIVVYIHPQTRLAIIHRVVGKKKVFCFIRGDNSYSTDGLIPDENILGVVRKIERKGQKLIFGFGPERFLIALLSRSNSLLPLLMFIKKLIRLNVRSSTA